MNNLALWHDIMASRDPNRIGEIIADDCVFLSPVVHTPQRGRDITLLYLTGAMHVLQDGFRYQKEIVDGRHAVLEFICEVDGLEINGVDIISFDEAGQICEFKVMVRPLKAINKLHQKMAQMLEQLSA